MERVKKRILITRARSWSDVHLADKREKLLSAIVSSKRDKNVHAIFMQGDEPFGEFAIIVLLCYWSQFTLIFVAA